MGNTYYIDPINGSDPIGTGTFSSPKRTLAVVLSMCSPLGGDIIKVFTGQNGMWYIHSSYADTTTLFASKTIIMPAVVGQTVLASGLILGDKNAFFNCNLEFQNIWFNGIGVPADSSGFVNTVNVQGAVQTDFRDCKFTSDETGDNQLFAKVAVQVKAAYGTRFYNPEITHTGVGLEMDHTSYCYTYNLNCHDINQDGVHFTSSDHCMLDGGRITRCDDGVNDDPIYMPLLGAIHPDCIQIQMYGGVPNSYNIIRGLYLYSSEGQGIQWNNYLQGDPSIHNHDFLIENCYFGATGNITYGVGSNPFNAGDPSDNIFMRHCTFKKLNIVWSNSNARILPNATTPRTVNSASSLLRWGKYGSGGYIMNCLLDSVDFTGGPPDNAQFEFNVVYNTAVNDACSRTNLMQVGVNHFANPTTEGDPTLLSTSQAINFGTSACVPADPSWVTAILTYFGVASTKTKDILGNSRCLRPTAGCLEWLPSTNPPTDVAPVRDMATKTVFVDDFNGPGLYQYDDRQDTIGVAPVLWFDPFAGADGWIDYHRESNLPSLPSFRCYLAHRTVYSDPRNLGSMLCATQGSNWTDVTVSYQIYIGEIHGEGPVLFYKNQNNYYWLNLTNQQLYRIMGGVSAAVGAAASVFGTSSGTTSTHTLRAYIDASGIHFTSGAWTVLDNDTTAKTTFTSGTFGFVTQPNTIELFKRPYFRSVSYTVAASIAGSAPTISVQPVSVSRAVGVSASFTVTASGVGTLTYQWFKAGVTISGATSSTYIIAAVGLGDAANYTVSVSNSFGTVTSSAATLTVTTGTTVPPTITQQPTGFSALVGQAASFTVIATGTAPLTYTWSKNGVVIPGANSATYSIFSVVLSDAGSFSVEISNPGGNVVSNSVTLSVNQVSSSDQFILSPARKLLVHGGKIMKYTPLVQF